MQKLRGKGKQIVLAVATILLVMGVVCSVVLNINTTHISNETPIKVKVLGITENVTSGSTAKSHEDGEKTEEGEKKQDEESETTEVSQIAGKKPENAVITVGGVNYASRNHTIKLEIDGTDNDKVANSTLSINDIVVLVNNAQVNCTKSFETTNADLNDGKNGRKYVLVLTNVPGDGQLKISIPANTLTDEAGLENDEITSAFDSQIIIDNTSPTKPTYVASFTDGSGNYTSGTWTNKEVTTTVSTTETGCGVEEFQYSLNGTTWNRLSSATSNMQQTGTTFSGSEVWNVINGRNDTTYFRAVDNVGNVSEISDSFNIKYDTSVPTIYLAKESYQEGFDGWTMLEGASIDNDGVLTITGLNKQVGQKNYRTQNEPWYITYDAYVTNASPSNTTGGFTGSEGPGQGGIYWEAFYYDTNYNEATANNGHKTNGFIGQLPLNTWSNNIRGSYGSSYGNTTEYTNINIRTASSWSNPPIKIRNFKMHGQLYTESYDINLTPNGTGSNIASAKWLAGNHAVGDFASSGTPITNNTFRVTENGTYTVFVADEAGNSTISTIEVTKIDKTAPTIEANAEYNGGNISFTAKDIAPNATEAPSGVVGYQITNSNQAPTSGWTNVVVPDVQTVDGKQQTSQTITATNAGVTAGTNYIWVIDAAGHKTSKQISVYYNIALASGEGVTTTGTTTVKANAATLPDITAPTKTGYTFGGYFTAVNGGGTKYYNENGTPAKANDFKQDTILYAKWTANNYTVTANANGGTIAETSGWTGTGAQATKSVTYDSTYDTLPEPTRTGYTFKGWNGKNLIDPSEEYAKGYTGYIDRNKVDYNSNTNVYTVNSKQKYDYLYGHDVMNKVEIGKTYTFSVEIVSKSEGTDYIWIGADMTVNGTRYTRYNPVAQGNIGDRIAYSFVVPEGVTNCVVGLINSGSYTGLQYKNPQLEEGSTATAYEPYYITAETHVTTALNHDITAIWQANPLTFNNQTIEKTYNTAAQTANVTAATNGTGSYTYTKKSGEADITVAADGTITIPAGKNAGTYTIVINATDNDSGSTKDATYTINIAKAKITIPSSPAAKTYNGQVQASGITTPANTSIVETPELITNGDGSYGDNTNFSAWTYDANESYNGSNGSFRYSENYSVPTTRGQFALSTQDGSYTLSLDAKTTNGNSPYYGVIFCLDIDGYAMTAGTHMFVNGSTTTLSQDLKPGDTVVHFTNLSGWNTSLNAAHNRGFIFWNYKNSKGFTYPVETYSRNSYFDLYSNANSIDVDAGTITLKNAWAGNTIPAGTAVSQSSSGGSYKYVALNTTYVPTTWTHYTGTISGTDYSGNNDMSKFPPYAVYGQVGFLWNYNNSENTGYITNVSLTGKSITSATNVGTYSVAYQIDDPANYEWSDGTTTLKTVPWIINPYDISGNNSTVGAIANQDYTGSAITPNPTITALNKTLTKDIDYSINYKNNIGGENEGAIAYIWGKGNFCGSKTANFTIDLTVTADANGGSIPSTTGWTGTGDSATKTVTYDSAYGTLPTPTKTGYTFKGWNGKNLFDEETILMAIDGAVHEDGYYTFHPLNADAAYGRITVNADSNIGNKNMNISFKENTQYTLSFKGYTDYIEEAGVYQTFFIGFFYTDGTSSRIYISGATETEKILTSTEGKTVSRIATSYGRHNAGANAHIKNIQLEEGGEATPYEPYYITSTTPVTTAGNHNINAKWTPAIYTITLNNQSAATPGTTAIYEKYSIGYYSNSAATTVATSITTPTKSGYNFLGYYTGENGTGTQIINELGSLTANATYTAFTANTTLYAKWEATKIDVKYAVQIYGINQDVDANGNPIGLTFGPATGENYNNRYVTHEYVETSSGSGIYNVMIKTYNVAANGTETLASSVALTNSSGTNVTRTAAQVTARQNINLHTMSWQQIYEVQDKTLFEDCMLCGDTKSVSLTLNDTIASGTTQTAYGDGAGMLYSTMDRYYRVWNPSYNNSNSTYNNSAVGTGVTLNSNEKSEGSNARQAGGYSSSHVRASLIGENSKTNIGYAGDVNLSSSTSLLSCIESDLQEVITPKKVKYATGTGTSSYTLNDDITDSIWLFSDREMYGNGSYSGNTTEGVGSSGDGYAKFSNTESKYYIASYNDSANNNRVIYNESGSAYSFWLRSIFVTSTYNIRGVYTNGSYSQGSAKGGVGLAFGFCIGTPAPQWEISQDNDSNGTLSVGDLIAPTVAGVTNEKFYVIGKDDTEGTVTLLSQYCVDWNTANAQDPTMGINDEGITRGTLEFRTDYRAANANIYSASDIKGKVDVYASKLVTAGLILEDVEVVENGTPVTGTKGRLMWGTDTSGEVQSILGSSLTNKNDIVYGPSGAKLDYWLGSPNEVSSSTTAAWCVWGYENRVSDYYVSSGQGCALRPVIKVKTSRVISQTISALQTSATKPYLPTGYSIAQESIDAENATAGGALAQGLIITDNSGNEYVWVEVPRTIYSSELQAITPDAILTNEQYTAIENAMISYATSYRRSGYTDTYNSSMLDSNGELGNITNATEYNTLKKKMLKSVFDNGGFYVGRYEAGIPVANARSDSGDIASNLVPLSKANVAPLNYVTCSQAQTLASRIAPSGYTSSLMFGIQWDLMLKFMEVKTGSAVTEFTQNSGSWGNYSDVSFNVNSLAQGCVLDYDSLELGEYEDINPNIKPSEYDVLTTGATVGAEAPDNNRNSKANIHDVAGNVWEWTLEKTSDDSYPCCYRGGNYISNGSFYPAVYRGYYDTSYSDIGIGFRVTLYE